MLGSLGIKSSSVQTLKGLYSDFPCVKRMFLCEGGTGTYAAPDIVSGAALLSFAWVSTGPFTSYMNVNSEATYPTGHHNVALSSGSWDQPARKSAIYFLYGRFTSTADGSWSFGFGDSTPNNVEIVFSQVNGVTGYSVCKFNPNQSIFIPDILSGQYVPHRSGSVLGFIGLIIDETNQQFTFFMTDDNDNYISASRPISDYPDYAGCNLPATYSMGRADAATVDPGIVDLGVIGQFVFSTTPTDISEAFSSMAVNWRNGNKTIWEAWKGRT